MQVKLLEAISPYSKGEIIEMREDLAEGIYKGRVEILEKTEKEEKQKDLDRMNKLEIEGITEDNTKAEIIDGINKYIEEKQKEDKSMEGAEKENKGFLSKLLGK